MKEGKWIGKIFGIAIVFFLIGAMLATALPLGDLGKSQVSAQESVSYIIVHALNPEGVEIASIEGMDPYCVEIYDGDTLIGYGARNEETYNKPIAIASGGHTIKANFNGMVKEQTLALNPSEIEVVIFTFDRTEFDLWSLLNRVWGGDSTLSYSHTFPNKNTQAEYHYYYWEGNYELSYGCHGRYVEGLASGSATLRYDVASYYSYGKVTSVITDVSYAMWQYGFQANGAAIYAHRTDGVACRYIEENLIPANSNFSTWYIQSITSGEYPWIAVYSTGGIHGCEITRAAGYTFRTLPTLAWDATSSNIEAYINGRVVNTCPYNQTFEDTKSGSLSRLEMSSVPYDITGTGIKHEENQPPVASFTYSPQDPVITEKEEIIEVATFNALDSYDPDGTITSYEWDFGDGLLASGDIVNHTYDEVGDYNVTLTVRDNGGASASSSAMISIREAKMLPFPKGAEYEISDYIYYDDAKKEWAIVTPPDDDINHDGVPDWFCESVYDVTGNGFALWVVDERYNGIPPYFAFIFSRGEDGKVFFIGKCHFGEGDNQCYLLSSGDLLSNGRLIGSRWQSYDGGKDDVGSAPGRDSWQYTYDMIEHLLTIIHYAKDDTTVLSSETIPPPTYHSPWLFNDLDPVVTEFPSIYLSMLACPAICIDFDPDVLNLRNERKFVTAYIELPTGYNVSQIGVSSISLNETVPALTKPIEVGDYDSDGIPDLMVKFDGAAVQNIVSVGEQVEITITGQVAGIAFEGSDIIRVIDR